MDSRGLERTLRELERRIADAERRLSNLPSRWAIAAPVKPAGLVKPTAPAGEGGGIYTGVRWLGPGTTIPPEAEDTLQEANLGTAGDEVVLVNVREVGKDTHDVEFAGYLPLIFPAVYLRTESDGTEVWAFDGYQWEDCE